MYYVYILSNQHHTTFYTGVTNDLAKRVWEHKQKLVPGHTAKYNIDKLLYAEPYETIIDARHREAIIKKWKRAFKFDAITKLNPNWQDLYYQLNNI